NPFAIDEGSVRALLASFNPSHIEEDILRSVTHQIRMLTPSFLIMGAGVDAFVSYLIVAGIENRRLSRQKSVGAGEGANAGGTAGEPAVKVHPMPPFGQWSFPRSLLAAFFAAFLITLFDASASSAILLSAEINLKVLTSVMFFIQGLGFAWWWMLRRNYSQWVRIAAFLVLLFVPIFSMGLVIIGILDIAADLRGKIRRNDK
ncbi:MAG: YybS family protein, partial [Synergistaceae bacterium]|nr:YybS family protein [Synergistaceae bacterium]